MIFKGKFHYHIIPQPLPYVSGGYDIQALGVTILYITQLVRIFMNSLCVRLW